MSGGLFFSFLFWGQWWIGLVVVEGAATDKFRLALDTAPVLLRISFLVLHNWMLPKTRWWCRSRGANWLFSFFCEGVCNGEAAGGRESPAQMCTHFPVYFQVEDRRLLSKGSSLAVRWQIFSVLTLSRPRFWGVFSFLPLPCKCKKNFATEFY